MKTSSRPNEAETLWDLIKETRFAMLTHRHPDGSLHSHPLTTQGKSLDDWVLRFFVSKATELGQRLQADGNVNVSYSNPDKDTYISISGQAVISGDVATKERLFNALAKAWFPGGARDPDLELVEVQVQHAEYWNVKENKTTQLYKIAKAAVTGERPKIGEHKELHPG
jgi:general stress protein 26